MSYNLDEFILPIDKLKVGMNIILLSPTMNNWSIPKFKVLKVSKINKNTVKFDGIDKLYKKIRVSKCNIKIYKWMVW